MQKFKVWTDGYNDEQTPMSIEEFDAEAAATRFVDDNYGDLDHPDIIDVVVVDPDGTKSEYTVSVEYEPRFYATKINGGINA